jgi:hypothetical protein
MDVYGQTWRISDHHEVECIDCHIDPGIFNFVSAKVSALREVWVHFTGEVERPIAVTHNVPNGTCTRSGCHNKSNVPTRVKLNNGQWFPHLKHWSSDVYCRDCHYQVVHKSIPGKLNVDIHQMEHCLTCHKGASRAPSACGTCHEPGHEPRGDCNSCHSAKSWLPPTFQHPVAYGKYHRKLACERCHTKATSKSIGFPAGCMSCHKKRHTPLTVRCAKCHVPSYWRPSSFRHPKTGCQQCHKRPHVDRGGCLQCHTTKSWAFVHPTSNCLRCHSRPHVDYGASCLQCHNQKSWAFIHPSSGCLRCHRRPHRDFGPNCLQCHTTSSFRFRHPTSSCLRCHSRPHVDRGECLQCHTTSSWRFRHPSSTNCASCHRAPHANRGACVRCHNTRSWAFHHPTSGNCGSCHTPPHADRGYCLNCHTTGSWAFRHPASGNCASCHGSRHGGLTNCAQCHTTSAWLPSTFRHQQVGEHIPSGEVPLNCSACHPSGFASSSCSCHGPGGPEGD